MQLDFFQFLRDHQEQQGNLDHLARLGEGCVPFVVICRYTAWQKRKKQNKDQDLNQDTTIQPIQQHKIIMSADQSLNDQLFLSMTFIFPDDTVIFQDANAMN